jgi:hypothetical protein
MATAPAATSDGLTISGVVAYRLSDAQNAVAVAVKLTDTSYRPIKHTMGSVSICPAPR